MLPIEKWSNDPAGQKRLLARAELSRNPALAEQVAAILREVKNRGDDAVFEFMEKFDRVKPQALRVSEAELDEAVRRLDEGLLEAMLTAKANITAFHAAQRPQPTRVETQPGVVCEMVWRGLSSVGLYVPGGTAPLFSSVFMLAIPALLAGCRRIVLCAPPQKDGKMNAATMAAARLCGVTDVFAVGGAQAIAAMAYGTAQIPKVFKIFGPGNAYVTMAKQLVAQEQEGAAIDMPAGPSEVMVMATAPARADWIAADLLAQAEHDAASQAVLVTDDEALAKGVQAEIEKQKATLPRRAIVEESLKGSRILLVKDRAEAIEAANLYAPEHLIIHDKDAASLLPEIQNASSVFLGPYTPETAGDYASGTNHVLPTYGAARAYSGLSLFSFMKSVTLQTISREGLDSLAPALVQMAKAEGLDAHAAAVTARTGSFC